jgi:hypothetical protein
MLNIPDRFGQKIGNIAPSALSAGAWFRDPKCDMHVPSDCRYGLDIDHELRNVKSRHFNHRHCGGRRRRGRCEKAIPFVSIGWQIIHVPKEDGQFDQIACCTPDRLQGYAQISEYLRRLRSKITIANEFAFFVKRSLTRDEDDATGANVDNLGITGWRAKFRRI